MAILGSYKFRGRHESIMAIIKEEVQMDVARRRESRSSPRKGETFGVKSSNMSSSLRIKTLDGSADKFRHGRGRPSS